MKTARDTIRFLHAMFSDKHNVGLLLTEILPRLSRFLSPLFILSVGSSLLSAETGVDIFWISLTN